jgi:hypothetical protein
MIRNFFFRQLFIVFIQLFSQRKRSGLPDGIFSNRKSKFGLILVGFAIIDVGIFYVHLLYITDIGHILWPFGLFPVFGIFFTVLVSCSIKIWQPCKR